MLGAAGLVMCPQQEKKVPSLDDFLYHWYNKHSKDIHYRWTTIALDLGISREELASACLSVNLDTCPLPSSAVGLLTVPKSLPDRRDGHNKLVFGPPWNVTIRGDFTLLSLQFALLQRTFSIRDRQRKFHQALGFCLP